MLALKELEPLVQIDSTASSTKAIIIREESPCEDIFTLCKAIEKIKLD